MCTCSRRHSIRRIITKSCFRFQCRIISISSFSFFVKFLFAFLKIYFEIGYLERDVAEFVLDRRIKFARREFVCIPPQKVCVCTAAKRRACLMVFFSLLSSLAMFWLFFSLDICVCVRYDAVQLFCKTSVASCHRHTYSIFIL